MLLRAGTHDWMASSVNHMVISPVSLNASLYFAQFFTLQVDFLNLWRYLSLYLLGMFESMRPKMIDTITNNSQKKLAECFAAFK